MENKMTPQQELQREFKRESEVQKMLVQAQEQIMALQNTLFAIPTTERFGSGVANLRIVAMTLSVQLSDLRNKE
jgi:hypothetical protein